MFNREFNSPYFRQRISTSGWGRNSYKVSGIARSSILHDPTNATVVDEVITAAWRADESRSLRLGGTNPMLAQKLVHPSDTRKKMERYHYIGPSEWCIIQNSSHHGLNWCISNNWSLAESSRLRRKELCRLIRNKPPLLEIWVRAPTIVPNDILGS